MGGIVKRLLAGVSAFTAFNYGLSELVDVNLLTSIAGTGEALTITAAGVLAIGAYQLSDVTGLKDSIQERNQ